MTEPFVAESARHTGAVLDGLSPYGTFASSLQTLSAERLLASWVGETLLSAERAALGDVHALSIFWVRLYGVLTDVADFVALTFDAGQANDGLCMFPLARSAVPSSLLPLAMAHLRSVLDDDELLYVEYRRHAECDPFQARYRSRRRLGAAALVPSALLGGRAITAEQAEAAFQRLLARHELSEQRLGSELARRCIVALRALRAAAG